ncbi:MAG: hypothetical protein ACREBU_03270 [Nitrososphaera sp.]
MFPSKVLEHYGTYRQQTDFRIYFNRLILPVAGFSILYAAFEYYLITDPSYGIRPIMFSLIYPYHLVMAGVFGIAAYSVIILSYPVRKNGVLTLLMVGAIFSVMLVIEDFTWFTFRAVAPRDGDLNAGKLVVEGEWTTQFIGSTSFHFTAVPNWYFLSAFYAIIAVLTVRAEHRKDGVQLPMNRL